MNIDWEAESVSAAWAIANGGSKYPYGDMWRMMLINPIVLNVAKSLQDERDLCSCTAIYTALANQRAMLKGDDSREGLVAWHSMILGNPDFDLTDLDVVDFGCGEGYLGRWLSSLGARYVGVDCSKPLLSIADERLKSAPPKMGNNCQYLCYDLDKDSVGGFLGSLEFRKKSKRLFTACILLDHLEKPGDFLGKLTSFDDQHTLLIFTLNMEYFWKKRSSGALKETAHISSANDTPVTVFFRNEDEIERLLRDARYQIITSSPVPFPISTTISEEPYPGVPPFRCFICRPMPVPTKKWRGQTNRELVETLTAPTVAASIPLLDAERKFLKARASELEIIEHKEGSVVFRADSLGGDLVVVLEGCLELTIPESKTTFKFKEGELIGDLETGENGRYGRFIYDTIAFVDSVILRIPAIVVDELRSQNSYGLGEVLFRKLRDRLSASIWLQNIRTKNPKLDTALPGGIKPRDLDATVRGVLACSEAEKNALHRSGGGQIVFANLSELLKMTQLDLVNGNPINRVLAVLTQLGFIDAFTGQSAQQGNCNDDYLKSWEKIVVDSGVETFRSCFARPDGNVLEKEWTLFLGNVLKNYALLRGGKLAEKTILSAKNSAGEKEYKYKHTKDGLEVIGKRSSLWESRPAHISPQDWQDKVNIWWSFISRVNAFWFDQLPSLIAINDIRGLRSIVHRDIEVVVKMFEKKQEHLGLIELETTLAGATKDAKKTGRRVHLFIQKATDFFLEDFYKCNGSMKFTASNNSYSITSILENEVIGHEAGWT